MKRILVEELNSDSLRLLDKIIGSISHKYAGNYGIDQDDLYQELQLKYYEKFGNYTDEDLKKNKSLVDRSLENVAIDYYRYTRRRYDSQDHYIEADAEDLDNARHSKGQLSHTAAGGSRTGERSGNIGRNRFKKTDENIVVREMFDRLKKKYGAYADETRYFIGMVSLQGLLDSIKDLLVKGDYQLAKKIKDKNDIGEFIDPDDPLATGNSRYRRTAKNVADFLKKLGY